jgi:SAM-dependent methyltransferase
MKAILQQVRRWVRSHERLRRIAGKLAGKVSRLLAHGLNIRDRWSRAIPYEATFWEDWLATRAFGDEQQYRARLDPTLRVSERLLADRLDEITETEVTILDVGAGPLTTVGRTYPAKELRITAIDPLAADYARILADAGISPPVPTLPGEGERLLEIFAPGEFDIAYAANALDHSYDPLLAIRNMVEVVKPGGYVLLRHRRNEAEAKSYLGLHQWNFDVRDGRWIVWNSEIVHDMAGALSGSAEVRASIEGEEVFCVLTRLGPVRAG